MNPNECFEKVRIVFKIEIHAFHDIKSKQTDIKAKRLFSKKSINISFSKYFKLIIFLLS